MSLIPFENFFMPTERYSLMPWSYGRRSQYPGSGILSSMLNDGYLELQRLERELGELMQGGKDNNDPYSLVFRCNVAGYRPDELRIDMEGNELIIQGEHKDASNGQSIHRNFVRRLTLPEGVEQDLVECNLNERGQLEVKAHRKAIDQPKKHKIPIGFKQSDSTPPTVENAYENTNESK